VVGTEVVGVRELDEVGRLVPIILSLGRALVLDEVLPDRGADAERFEVPFVRSLALSWLATVAPPRIRLLWSKRSPPQAAGSSEGDC